MKMSGDWRVTKDDDDNDDCDYYYDYDDAWEESREERGHQVQSQLSEFPYLAMRYTPRHTWQVLLDLRKVFRWLWLLLSTRLNWLALVRCWQGVPHLHLFWCVIDVDYLGQHIGQKHEDNKNPDPHDVKGNISTNLCRFIKVFIVMWWYRPPKVCPDVTLSAHSWTSVVKVPETKESNWKNIMHCS